jgi:hypothetical protein
VTPSLSKLGRQHLDCYVTGRRVVVGAIDDPHAAPADFLDDFVFSGEEGSFRQNVYRDLQGLGQGIGKLAITREPGRAVAAKPRRATPLVPGRGRVSYFL